jgi:hypothetical protein
MTITDSDSLKIIYLGQTFSDVGGNQSYLGLLGFPFNAEAQVITYQ